MENGIDLNVISAFTRFVRKLQREAMVLPALTSLQQRHTININLLLFALWFAQSQHGRLRKVDYQQLDGALQPWHDKVLAALERIEKQLGDSQHRGALQMRPWVMNEVTTADEIEQHLLHHTMEHVQVSKRSLQQQSMDACHNLALLCRLHKASLNAADKEALGVLLQSVFPNQSVAELRHNFSESLSREHVDETGCEQLNLV